MAFCWRGLHRCISKHVCLNLLLHSQEPHAVADAPTEQDLNSIQFRFSLVEGTKDSAPRPSQCMLLHMLVSCEEEEIFDEFVEYCIGSSNDCIATALLDHCLAKMQTSTDTVHFSCDARFLAPDIRAITYTEHVQVMVRLERYCEEVDVLPASFIKLPLKWKLRKRTLSVGHGNVPARDSNVTYKLLDVKVPQEALGDQYIPAQLLEDVPCSIKLGSGEVCEALEFTLPTMACGESARVFTSWELLASRPPKVLQSMFSAVTLKALKGMVELVIEVIDVAKDANEDFERAPKREIAWAQERLRVAADLYKHHRFMMALSIYLDVQSTLEARAPELHQDETIGIADTIAKTCELNTVQCYLHLQAWTAAINTCSAALHVDSANVKWLYLQAKAMLGARKFKEAHQSLKAILKVDPGSKAAKNLLEEVVKRRNAFVAHEKRRIAFSMREACKAEVLSTGRDAGRLEGKTNLEQEYEDQLYSQIVANGWEPDPNMPTQEKLQKFCKPEVVNFFDNYSKEREQRDLMEQWGMSQQEAAEVQIRGHL